MPADGDIIITSKKDEKGVDGMSKVEKQRIQNITVWIPRKYHKRLKMIAWNKGVSITYILGKILEKYFRKGEE